MAGRVSFLLCLGAAVALHAGALMVFEPRLETAARDPGVRVSAAGASDEIAALVEAWNTPPDVGEADDLAEVDVEETPPDTEAAEVADAAVEADATADDLGEHTGPGKEAVRPIMAKLPTPKTSAPKQIALRSPEPQSFNLASLSTPEPSSPSFGAGLASPGGTVGGGLGSPAPAGSPSLGFTIPLEVEDEPTAPENAPLPVARPDAEELARREANPPDIPELEVLFEDDAPSEASQEASENSGEDPEPVASLGGGSLGGALGGPSALASLGSPGGTLGDSLGGGLPGGPGAEPAAAPSLPGSEQETEVSAVGLPSSDVPAQAARDAIAPPLVELEAGELDGTGVLDGGFAEPAPTTAVLPRPRPELGDPEREKTGAQPGSARAGLAQAGREPAATLPSDAFPTGPLPSGVPVLVGSVETLPETGDGQAPD